MSILENGSPSAPFKMERGLRQGDPSSPFLIFLATEAFNQMMMPATENEIIKGITVGNRNVIVSHLQFADDTLIFCLVKRKILTNIRRMMDCFQVLSGLRINFSKSGLIALGRSKLWGEQMAAKLGCKLIDIPISYLGIPLGDNSNKASTWSPVIEKVRKKLDTWKSKVLSRAGRLVLIKSVLNSLPLYYMGLFKVPKSAVR